MQAESIPLVVGVLIFISSLVSLRLGVSVAIIEIVAGVIAGNLGLPVQEWMTYLAGFGGIVLTFLAGTEVDRTVLRKQFRASFLIGFGSFLVPFLACGLFVRLVAGWSVAASLIAGIALASTSLAVVYSVLVETGLARTALGKTLMAATFICEFGVALALSVIFLKPTLFTVLFVAVSLLVILIAHKFSLLILRHPALFNKVIEPEIKYIFVLLLALMYFARLGDGQAILPAFVLGLLMSKHFTEQRKTRVIRNRLRTVAYALITPVFFIVGGMRLSLPLVVAAAGPFLALLAVRLVAKFAGTWLFARKYLPRGRAYATLLMSTGLTFGTIASVFGLQAGLIDQVQYSVLIGVVVVSAVIPTFVAQRWFRPVHAEDILE